MEPVLLLLGLELAGIWVMFFLHKIAGFVNLVLFLIYTAFIFDMFYGDSYPIWILVLLWGFGMIAHLVIMFAITVFLILRRNWNRP